MIFHHTTSALHIRQAGLLLTDLSRPHVVRILGLHREYVAPPRPLSWNDLGAEAPPAVQSAILDYQEGRLRGNQEAIGKQPHHPVVPSFFMTAGGEALMLEHQVDSDEEPDTGDAATFSVPALGAHRFIHRPGVQIRLLYEDETPIDGALVELSDEQDQASNVYTSKGGWMIAARPSADDASIRIRLLRCVENQAPAS